MPKYSIHIRPFDIPMLIALVGRCGGYDRRVSAEITITTKNLDEEGFVVHNEKLVEKVRNQFAYAEYERPVNKQALDGSVVWRASCEQLTEGIAYVVADMIPAERLLSMNIKAYNHMGYTTLDWVSGDEIPSFPRRATEQEIADTIAENKRRGYSSSC